MQSTSAGWIVIDRDAAILTYTYHFAADGTANTFVARMGNGQLMVVSPPTGLHEAAFAELAEFGEVGALVANNGFHHLGQAAWRARFPDARCFAPAEAIPRIKKKNPADLPFEPLSALADLAGPTIGFREAANTKCGESWFWVAGAEGPVWFMSDVLANIPELPGKLLPRLMFKLSKSAPGYRPFGLALKFIVKDKKATLRALRADVSAHPPRAVVPAHGDILHGDDLLARTHAAIDLGL